MPGHSIAGAEGGAMAGDALGKHLQIIDLPGANQKKAFRDQATQRQSERGPVYGNGSSAARSQAIARQGRKILDHGEDLLDGGSGDLVETELGSKMRIVEQFVGDGVGWERPLSREK